MKLTSVIALLLASTAVNAMLIQEIYPDPIKTDTGGEAVLLYNNENSAIDISGWTLATPSSAIDATIPANTTLEPHQLYLISDLGFSTNKDDESWADADHEEAITLNNAGGSVALRNGNSTIDNTTYPAATEGIAYWRDGNTLVVPTEPLFTAPLDALYTLTLAGSKGNSNGSIQVLDDGKPAGNIRLVAGGNKNLEVTVESDTEPFIMFLGKSQSMDRTGDGSYTATIPLNHTTAPGAYNVTAVAERMINYPITVLPLLAIESDITTLQLGNISKKNLSVTGDTIFGTPAPTLRNSGNVAVEVYLSRTTVLNNGTKTTATVNARSDGQAINVTTKASLLITILPGEAKPLSITLTLPDNAGSGSYSTSFAMQLKER
jgi:hypothetical protein